MRRAAARSAALALAAALAAATPAVATGPGDMFEYAPSLRAPVSKYPFDEDDLGPLSLRLGRQCFRFPDDRGVRLQAREDDAGGSFRYGFPVGGRFGLWGAIDVSRLDTPGAFAGIEFRTPAMKGADFLFLGVARYQDGSLGAFASDTGTNVGTPAFFPGDMDCLDLELSYANGEISASYGYGGVLTPVLSAHPFAYGGSGDFGAGLAFAGKGDRVVLTIEVTGDLHAPATQGVLSDLQAAIALEEGAKADLMAGMPAEAKTKLEQAEAIFEMGTQVPGSDPPVFTGALIPRAQGLYPGTTDVANQIGRQLGKARENDGKAIDHIDGGRLEPALKKVDSALQRKQRGKAVIETGVAGERPL